MGRVERGENGDVNGKDISGIIGLMKSGKQL